MPLLSFSGTAFLATLFLSAAAMPTSKSPQEISLVLSLEVPSSVDDVGDFTITGTLKSNSTKDIKVVTDPSGILYSYFAADVLDFKKELDATQESDKMTEEELDEKTKPRFVGGRAKWSIETYLTHYVEQVTFEEDEKDKDTEGKSPGSSDYTSDDDTSSSQVSASDSSNTSEESSQVEGKTYPPHTTYSLAAGESMDFEYNVGQGYNFKKSGSGVYNVKLSRDFFWVLVDDVLTKVGVNVKSSTVTIQGKLFSQPKNVETSEGDTKKRAFTLGTVDCSPVQTVIINRSAKIANQLVASSIESLDTMKTKGEDRAPYEHWFGEWETKPNSFQSYWPREHVSAMYSKIRSFNLPGYQGGYTYDCACDQNIFAWIVIGDYESLPEHLVIHLCKLFRAESVPVAGGTDTKAGTLIHEATHFPFVRPRARDITCGTEDAHALRLKPFDAIRNADSYEYFAEGLYESTP